MYTYMFICVKVYCFAHMYNNVYINMYFYMYNDGIQQNFGKTLA